ncbi:MAG: hypothetical protein HRU19_08325 [Pseudobacteriovorax sp.]|nr:hypothetical protein [Pseudobacteriovorax sp.]
MSIQKKVQKGFIDGRVKRDIPQLNSIDSSVIDMLRSLELPEAVASFSESLDIYSQKLASSLKRAHTSLESSDLAGLEESALDLSQNALRIGAVNMLKASFELQNVARCRDITQAEAIVQNLELEYLKVRRDLETYV